MVSRVYLECDNTARTNGRTGIQAVVRGLVLGLLARKCEVHPIRWSFDQGYLTPLKPRWRRNLGMPETPTRNWPLRSLLHPKYWSVWIEPRRVNHKFPIDLHPAHAGRFKKQWVVLPELMEELHAHLVTGSARRQGMRVAGIFHDAIAWLYPARVLHWTQQQHADYMLAFAKLDVVIAVSQESARHFLDFLKSQGVSAPPVRVCNLAAQVPGQKRETQPKENRGDVVKILCVSTLEPRKNHIRVLNAFQTAARRVHPRKLELHLVGGAYESAPEISGAVRALTRRNSSIFWHENVGFDELSRMYRECDFTVFGSWIEGFGIPVLESLWFGRPCLCSHQGPMAENAEGGGCLTVDVQDPEALAEGITRMAGDSAFRQELERQALSRPLKTWEQYSSEILQILSEMDRPGKSAGK